MELGLYLHLPFCKSKCPYCDFFSLAEKPEEELYLRALFRELELLSDYLKRLYPSKKIIITTFYAGGGTPSLFSPSFFERLFEKISQTFEFKPFELTLEANPESLTFKKAKAYKAIGFNRLSIGIQTFQEKGLKFLGRIHSKKEALKAIENGIKAGFENLSLDFIYGWKGEGLKTLKRDLELALSFEVTHLSFYELTLYPETPFYEKYGQTSSFLKEKRLLGLFSFIKNYLQEAGFHHYEISNYARSGFECKHNLKYWKVEPYLGIGAGAVSRVGIFRFENTRNLKDYFEKLLGEGVLPKRVVERLNKFELAKEYLFMGLRMTQGIEFSKLKGLGYTLKEEALFLLDKRGYLNFTEKGITLSERGMPLHNQVVKFLWENLEVLR